MHSFALILEDLFTSERGYASRLMLEVTWKAGYAIPSSSDPTALIRWLHSPDRSGLDPASMDWALRNPLWWWTLSARGFSGKDPSAGRQTQTGQHTTSWGGKVCHQEAAVWQSSWYWWFACRGVLHRRRRCRQTIDTPVYAVYAVLEERNNATGPERRGNCLPLQKQSCEIWLLQLQRYHSSSVASGILVRVLLDRLISNIAEENLSEIQYGFRENRGTTDMIFVLRQLQEQCKEQNMGLYAAFINLTKAFDTVSRDCIWKVLMKLGCPPKFLAILQQLWWALWTLPYRRRR